MKSPHFEAEFPLKVAKVVKVSKVSTHPIDTKVVKVVKVVSLPESRKPLNSREGLKVVNY